MRSVLGNTCEAAQTLGWGGGEAGSGQWGAANIVKPQHLDTYELLQKMGGKAERPGAAVQFQDVAVQGCVGCTSQSRARGALFSWEGARLGWLTCPAAAGAVGRKALPRAGLGQSHPGACLTLSEQEISAQALHPRGLHTNLQGGLNKSIYKKALKTRLAQ